jgi:hypothetical protein
LFIKGKGTAMSQQATLDAPLSPTFGGDVMDTTPEKLGELRPSIDAIEDRDELHLRMARDGYLFLPGYLDRDKVIAARLCSLERLAEKGIFADGHPLEEGVVKPGIEMRSAMDVPFDNPPLRNLLYDGRMMSFYEFFLGGQVRHYDHTWFRAKTPFGNVATPPHCDTVYMSRGSQRLFTSWTPLGDVPRQMGGLLILEESHLQQELKATYGQCDVDVYCENVGDATQVVARARAEGRELTDDEKKAIRWTTLGAFADTPMQARDQLGGRWLTADYEMGDLLLFTMYTMHSSHDNQTNQIRISTDSRYQLASEPVDERWIGDNPPGNDMAAKQGRIC